MCIKFDKLKFIHHAFITRILIFMTGHNDFTPYVLLTIIKTI